MVHLFLQVYNQMIMQIHLEKYTNMPPKIPGGILKADGWEQRNTEKRPINGDERTFVNLVHVHWMVNVIGA